MKDVTGRPVQIGDTIVYTMGSTDKLYFGVVTRLTASYRIYLHRYNDDRQPELRNGVPVESWINYTHEGRIYIL